MRQGLNRSTVYLTVLLIAALALPMASCKKAEEPQEPAPTEAPEEGPMEEEQEPMMPEKDIVETAIAADGFSTLVQAVRVAGLVDTLKGKGPFTVFAPTDAAFGQLPEGTLESLLEAENVDQLREVLTCHVVAGKVMAADVLDMDAAESLSGMELPIEVEGGTVMVAGATVVETDIDCSNGVIHVIDTVIVPPGMELAREEMVEPPTPEPEPEPEPEAPQMDIVETAMAAESFGTLVRAVQAAGLVDTLKGEGPLTVFAPTDAAFDKLPEGTLESLLRPENVGQLQNILKCHVVSGKVMADDVMGLSSAESLAGMELPISTMEGTVNVAGATVVQPDIECSNGVIHVIDTVIVPPADEPAEGEESMPGEEDVPDMPGG